MAFSLVIFATKVLPRSRRRAPSVAKDGLSLPPIPDDDNTAETESLSPREQQKPQPLTLLRLPPELVLCVIDFLLDPVDTVCLALTCRRMYQFHSTRGWEQLVSQLQAETDKNAFSSLLWRLESTAPPGRFYCAQAQKITTFRCLPRYNKSPKEDHNWRRMLYCRHCDSSLYLTRRYVPENTWPPWSLPIPWNRERRISWCTARLVTNHRFLGPKHGIRPSVLARDFAARDLGDGVLYEEKWDAKVTHRTGELLLWSQRTFTHGDNLCGMAALRRYLDRKTISACIHTPGLLTHTSSETSASSRGYSTKGSCQTCEADWEAAVIQRKNSSGSGEDNRGWALVITTYQCLGDCRRFPNEKWLSATPCPGSSIPRSEAPGSARLAWNKEPATR